MLAPTPHWEKAMAPHSSTLVWQIPWTEEPGRLQSMGSRRVGTRLSNFTFTFHFHALEKEMATHSSVLAWRISGTGEPGGLPSMGSHRVGHDWSDLAAAAAAAAADSTYDKIGTVQRRLAWLLHRDDMQIHEVFHIFTATMENNVEVP